MGRAILRVITAALVVAALAGCGTAGAAADPDDPPVVVPGRPGEPAQVLPGSEAAERRTPVPVSPADVEFVARMVPHHEQALEMAALAPDRAADPGVRAMAERIAVAQGPEIAVMEAFLDRHGDGHDQHVGTHDMPGMATPAQMAELRAASGPAFDRLFLQLMIAHHEGALAMVEVVRTQGTDITVGDLARGIASTQSAEIDRMRALLQ